MAKADKGYQKTFLVPSYKSSTLADATTMALTVTEDHEYVAIDTLAQNSTLNLTIDAGVKTGATLLLKVTSDSTGRSLTLGTGTDTSVISGKASKSHEVLLRYDGTTYNVVSVHELRTATDVGAVATGSTVVEYGDNYNHVSVITVATTLGAIAGGADLGLGKLVYTFPAGAVLVEAAYMSMALDESDGNITADTPDGGLGTTIASGAVSVLSGTAAFENILTGQTFNDCNGTAEVVFVGNQPLYIATAGAHTVYFNVADGWAAGGEAACGIAGTIILKWQLLI